MCCRACQGYELCQAQNQLRDDCCTKCTYFTDCMENEADEETTVRTHATSRRYVKPKK